MLLFRTAQEMMEGFQYKSTVRRVLVPDASITYRTLDFRVRSEPNTAVIFAIDFLGRFPQLLHRRETTNDRI